MGIDADHEAKNYLRANARDREFKRVLREHEVASLRYKILNLTRDLEKAEAFVAAYHAVDIATQDDVAKMYGWDLMGNAYGRTFECNTCKEVYTAIVPHFNTVLFDKVRTAWHREECGMMRRKKEGETHEKFQAEVNRLSVEYAPEEFANV